MKNICILLIMLLLVSCQLEKEKPDDNLNLRFEVLESEMKHIPTNVGIEESWDYSQCKGYGYIMFKPFQNSPCGKNADYIKLAKIRIINEGEAISLFVKYKQYFPLESWTSKGIEQKEVKICAFGGFNYNDCRFFLSKNDTATIYWGYSSRVQPNTDTLGFGLKWKRDSLGQDYVKFYMNDQKKLKHHSIEKGRRNSIVDRFPYYEYCCTILKEVVEDTVIREVRRY